MTFWQVSLSFKAHLAHLPSPVMVTSLPASAANDGVASGSKSSPAMPVNSAILFFIITSFFWFICVLPWVRYRQKIRQFGGGSVQRFVLAQTPASHLAGSANGLQRQGENCAKYPAQDESAPSAVAPSSAAFWEKTSRSFSAVTRMGSPSWKMPLRISSAKGSSRERSTARRIGRAPYCGSCPLLTRRSLAFSSSWRTIFRALSR